MPPDTENTSGAVAAYLNPTVNMPAVEAKASMQVAVDTNPDYEAELRRASARTGVPLDSARAFPDDVKRQAAVDSHDYEQLAAQFPSTTKFLADPNNARISHDDVDNMSSTESTIGPIRGPKPTFMTYARGLLDALPVGAGMAREGIRMQMADLYDKVGLFNPAANAAMRADAQGKYGQMVLDQKLTNPEFEGSTAGAVYGGLTSTLRNLPGVVASVATRSPTPMLATMGVQVESEAYGKYRARGASPGEALLGGAAEGALEVITEKLPMKFLVDNMGKVGAGHFLAGLLAREIPGEQLATLTQDAVDTAIANPDKTWAQYAAERPEAAYQTLVATLTQAGVMEGGHLALQRVAGRGQEAEHATAVGEALTQFNDLAAASKVRERDTSTAQAFFQTLMQDGRQDVWITPRALAESGMLDQITQAIPGIAEQMAQGATTGAEIKIPVADLMANLAGPDLATKIIPHLADEPGGFTHTTANEYMQSGAAQQLAEEVSRTLATKTQDTAFNASRDVVTAGMLEQLNTAGRFAPAVNEAYASMVGNFYAVQAAKLGITPEEMATRYPLQVRAEAMPGARTLDQVGATTFEETDSFLAAKSGAGQISGNVRDGALHISHAEIEEAQRGKGEGVRLYSALVDKALSKGLKVFSDQAVEADAVRVYEALGRRGYDVTRLPGGALEDGAAYGQNGQPAFEVKAKGTPANREDGTTSTVGDAGLTIVHGSGNAALTADDIQIVRATGQKQGKKGRTYGGFYGTSEADSAQADGYASMMGGQATLYDVRIKPGTHVLNKTGDVTRLSEKYIQELVDQGYGAVIGKDPRGRTEYVVIDKNAIGEMGPRGTLNQTTPGDTTGRRGSLSFGEDITAQPSVISLFQGADLSTFLHESGHFFLEVTNDIASRADAPADIRADMDALLKWFGLQDETGPSYGARHDAISARLNELDAAGTRDGAEWDALVAEARQIRETTTPGETVTRTALELWNSYNIEQKREYHEQFARGFEAYLFEGRAPTADLQGLFSRFRSWMINVYKSLTALNVELTPEVRGVFDRMAASTDAIQQAERDAGLAGMFVSKPEFMTEEEWDAYRSLSVEATQEAAHQLETRSLRDMQWLDNAKAGVLAKMQRAKKEARAAVEAEVTAEVMSEPVNQARTFLKRGDQKLSIASLIEMYGGEGDKFARLDWEPLGYGKYGMLAKDGITPDMAAEMFGYESGDAMVNDLLTAEPAKDKIAGLTDQRMLERHGDLIDEQSIDRAVNAALHNDAHSKFLATELNALNKATGGRAVLAKAAKAYAETAIARTALKDLRPDLFTAAARRAGVASEKAFKAADLAAAAAEKQKQLINTYAAKAAMDARDEIKKIATQFQNIAKGKDDTVSKTRDMDMVMATRAILAEFGIGTRGKKAVEYLAAVDAYDPAMAKVLRDRIEAATENAAPLKELTVEQVRGLRDEIDSLWFLAKRSRQMEVDGDLLDREEVQDRLRARLNEIGIPDIVPGDLSAITPAEVRLSKIQTAIASIRRVEAWAGAKDGANEMGPFRKFIWSQIKDAADAYRTDKIGYLKQFRNLLTPIAPTLKQVVIAAPELGYTFGKDKGGMGKVELLHAVLHTGNAGNKKKLLLGRNWASMDADGNIDTSKWDAFTARMVNEGVLKRADFDFAQGVWDLMESMKPAAQKAHRAAFGRYFDEVTADAFTITLPGASGTETVSYRGGYVPAIVDSRIVADAKTRALMEEETSALMNVMPSTSKGFTKSRVEYNRPLLLDLRLLAQHIDKVLLFTHMEQPVRDVRRVLTSNTVAYPLNRIDPAAFDGLLTPWLNRTARQQVETPVSGDNGLMRFFSVVRGRAGMAAMFANVSNTAQQITGFSIAALRVKPSHLMGAAVDFLRAPRETAAAVAGASPYMANRMENEVGAMTDAINDILLNPGIYESAKAWGAKHTYFLQSAVDNIMGPIIWNGAYNQAMETAPAGLSEQELETYARRLADSAVRETQGSTLPEDISRIETGNAFVRLFSQFTGYFNMQANILGTEFSRIPKEMGLRKGLGRGFYIMLFGFLAPAWVAQAIAIAFRGGPDDDDKDGGYLDDWIAQTFGWGTLRAGTALIPVAGPAINAMANTFNKKPYDDKISTSPAIAMIESAVSVPSDVYKLAAGNGSATKTVRDVATLLTLMTGFPVAGAARPVVYATEVASGKAKPTGPVDVARGTITGTASPASKGR